MPPALEQRDHARVYSNSVARRTKEICLRGSCASFMSLNITSCRSRRGSGVAESLGGLNGRSLDDRKDELRPCGIENGRKRVNQAGGLVDRLDVFLGKRGK